METIRFALHVSLDKVPRSHYNFIMKEREYLRLKAQIENEYREKRDALELIWKMSKDSASIRTNVKNPKRGAVHEAVCKAIPHYSGEFTVHDIEDRVKADNSLGLASVKRASIASVLNRLVGERIEVASQGSGKRPGRYRMIARAK